MLQEDVTHSKTMESPPESRISGNEEERRPLDKLEEPEGLLKGERTRDDFLSVALQLREPTPVAEIADLAGRGKDSAREYMRWFDTIGLVRKASDDPEQYETNHSYLYWRRVDDIRTSYEDTAIVERLQEVLDDITEYSERYDTDNPSRVDVVSAAADGDATVEAIWEEVSRWKTLLARRNLLEDALDRSQDRYRNPATADTDGSKAKGSA